MIVEHEVHIRVLIDETSYRMTCAICHAAIISVQTLNPNELKKAAELAGKLATTHYCVIQQQTKDTDRKEHLQ